MTHPSGSAWPRRFYLYRRTDVSGVSGLGRVADGVRWPDGTATLRWCGAHQSTAHYDDIETIETIHGHGGATAILWLDDVSA